MTLYAACRDHERDTLEHAMTNEPGEGPFAIDVGKISPDTPARCGLCETMGYREPATILIKIEQATAADVIRMLLDLAADHDRAQKAAWN